jgi:anti-sigma B factor antagonist
MSNLSIHERQFRGVTILDLAGKITLGGTNKQLHEAIKRLVLDGETQIVVNLEKVTYIDSSGLGELVAGFTTLKANKGALKLLNVPDRVVDLMTITKLYTVFEIFAQEIDAVYSFDVPADLTMLPLDGQILAGARPRTTIH